MIIIMDNIKDPKNKQTTQNNKLKKLDKWLNRHVGKLKQTGKKDNNHKMNRCKELDSIQLSL